MTIYNKFYSDKLCENCGRVRPVRADSKARYCRSCAGKLFYHPHPTREGSRTFSSGGYIFIRLGGKRILEHRLIAEFNLGRPLQLDEIVHHIDGNKTNNSWDNLRVLLRKKHNPGYILGYQEGLRAGYNKAKEEISEVSTL